MKVHHLNQHTTKSAVFLNEACKRFCAVRHATRSYSSYFLGQSFARRSCCILWWYRCSATVSSTASPLNNIDFQSPHHKLLAEVRCATKYLSPLLCAIGKLYLLGRGVVGVVSFCGELPGTTTTAANTVHRILSTQHINFLQRNRLKPNLFLLFLPLICYIHQV